MIRTRWTSLFAFAASLALAVPMAGCYVDGEAFGEGKVEGETEVESHYAGEAKTFSAAYSAGATVRIESYFGNVRVVRGSATDSVEVTFRPFITGTLEAAAAAEARIEAELDMSVRGESEIVIVAAREAGASAEIGADIEVKLPAGFSGDFQVDQVDGHVDVDLSGSAATATSIETTGRGDIRVIGATGDIGVATAIGNVDIDLASWSSEGGHVHVNESGSITVRVAAEANGTLVVNTPGGSITEPATVPSNWTKGEDCDTTTGSYVIGAGTGGTVDVWSHSGGVTLIAEAEAHLSAGFDVRFD